MRIAALVLALVTPAALLADIIYLNNGQVLVGRVVERGDDYVVVVTGGGIKALVEVERVEKIEEGEPDEIYWRHLKETPERDADAHYELGLWCEKVKLPERAKEEFEKALILEPDHYGARKKLGLDGTGGGEKTVVVEPPATTGPLPEVGGVLGRLLKDPKAAADLPEEERRAQRESALTLLEETRRRMCFAAGAGRLDGASRRMLYVWHLRWRAERLRALHVLYTTDCRSAIARYAARAVAAYNYYRILLERLVRGVCKLSKRDAKRRLEKLGVYRRRERAVIALLRVLGVKAAPEGKMLEAMLRLAAGDDRAAWKTAEGLGGWHFQAFIEVFAARLRADRSASKKGGWKATVGEILLARYVNDYRRAMGRLPLVIDGRLCRAARGHAREMSRLGYFGHVSPTPGRATPQERAAACGYDGAVGENIFKGRKKSAGPEGALAAWRDSTGHHRNLLGGWDPLMWSEPDQVRELLGTRWRSLGVGADGRMVVAVFGSVASYYFPKR